MKLYFETQAQLALFLMTCAMGFALGLLPDILHLLLGGRLRAVCDIVGFIIGFLMLTGYLILFSQATLRLYDLLGLCTGLTIYALGVRRLARAAVGRISAAIGRKKKEKQPLSNEAEQESE